MRSDIRLARLLADIRLAQDRFYYLLLYRDTSMDPAEREFYATTMEKARDRIERAAAEYDDYIKLRSHDEL